MARFAPWVGRNITELAGATDPSSCTGSMGPVEPLPMVNLQLFNPAKESETPWVSKGWAWDMVRSKPVQLVALVDRAGLVIGFGLPGFKRADEADGAPAQSGWISNFYAIPGKTVRAYGVVDDGQRICPLANRHYFPLLSQALASEQFAGTADIVPGRISCSASGPSTGLREFL